MASTPRSGVGRPRLSSQRTLEEAAAELFLEQGYPRTTVDQIASRAGVSRNTFFNYFGSKSDVLWVEVDAALDRLDHHLEDQSSDGGPMESLRSALLAIAAGTNAQSVPWALTQAELMGTTEDLQASGLQRLLRLQALLRLAIARRIERSDPTLAAGGRVADPLLITAAAGALAGAVVAAGGAWAAAGVSRERLDHYLDVAVAPVVTGFEAALAASRG
ncbi:TetR/AcrR family transcriptional regulator [Plantibacter sp. YIM 135249]|uniref:TetR/AcrR family transcriptional regulator n=1 Tax=Plantibacter sp. YIM 135249 TaxID=3423918 RepID=UPI003D32BE40